MSISSVSGTSAYTGASSASNSVVNALESQKEALEKQLDQVKKSKTDEKTKQEQIKQIQQQITQVEQEIEQAKNQGSKQGGSSNQNNDAYILSESLKGLVSDDNQGSSQTTDEKEENKGVEFVA